MAHLARTNLDHDDDNFAGTSETRITIWVEGATAVQAANLRDHLHRATTRFFEQSEPLPHPDGPGSTCGACGVHPGQTHTDGCENYAFILSRSRA